MKDTLADERIVRRLLLGQAVASVGEGVWFTTWAIYLTRVVGLPPTTIGVVVAVAATFGIIVSYPSGVIADRFGARGTLIAMTVMRGFALVAFCFVRNLWTLLPVAIIAFGTPNAMAGVRTSWICRLFGEDRQLTVLARSRVVQHIAHAVGASVGAGVLALGSSRLFVASVGFNAGTVFALAAITALLPREPKAAHPTVEFRFSAITNVKYMVTMLATAGLALCWPLMSTAMPLWISMRTAAPAWLSGVIVTLSSVLIAVFQVRVTKGMRDVGAAARAGRLAGLLFAVCCILFGAASWPHSVIAAAVLLAAGLVFVTGELLFVASSWGLSIGLMDNEQAGGYQGVAATAEATVMSIGSAIMALIVTAPSITGWLLLSVVFAAIGLVTPPLALWCGKQGPTHNAVSAPVSIP